MPIPFSDLGTEGITANVAYLRFTEEPEGEGLRAALFIISCRGEPLEFCFTRVEVPHSPLWHTGQARDFAVIALAEALFEAANRLPSLVLALASETSARCFSEGLAVHVPVCRVSTQDCPLEEVSEGAQHLSDSLYLYWEIGRPPVDSVAATLVEALAVRHLLLEPFDRASMGILEAYKQ